MDKESRIYVAGDSGLVGSALCARLSDYKKVYTIPHESLELTDYKETRSFFRLTKPEYVFIAAARVGGILDNDTFPVEFLDVNARIELNILRAATEFGVKKLLLLGSSCIYPRETPQPIPEVAILSGKLEPTNDAYAIAKLAGIIGCRSYNRERGTQFVAAMPTNVYGPNDNFDLHGAHVLPALINKFHHAKVVGAPTVELWGSGVARREFMYVDDLADACVHVMKNFVPASHAVEDVIINIGTGVDVSISALAPLIADIIGYKGKLVWNTSKPDGTLRKMLDVSRLSNLGWKSKTTLAVGIRKTYEWFLDNLDNDNLRI